MLVPDEVVYADACVLRQLKETGCGEDHDR